MKTYDIKPLEWKTESRLQFFRAKSSTNGYYRYDIVRFLNPTSNEWSEWRLDIYLGNKRFWPKSSGPISSANYKTLEEAQETANRHHIDFVEQFLNIYEEIIA